MKDFHAFIGKALMAIVIVVGGWLISGWVLTILWGWFIVPTFHLPALGIAPALGVTLVVRYLTRQDIDVESPERTTTDKWVRAVLLAMLPLISLFLGWVVHLFMVSS